MSYIEFLYIHIAITVKLGGNVLSRMVHQADSLYN